MKKYAIALALFATVAVSAVPARADDVGAVIGGTSGFFIAGPPGAIIGAIVGGIWGRPYWGPPVGPGDCYIDDHFVRHCRRMPSAW